jgi:hypothetical protein
VRLFWFAERNLSPSSVEGRKKIGVKLYLFLCQLRNLNLRLSEHFHISCNLWNNRGYFIDNDLGCVWLGRGSIIIIAFIGVYMLLIGNAWSLSDDAVRRGPW